MRRSEGGFMSQLLFKGSGKEYMKRIDRLLIKARKMFGCNAVVVAFVEKTSPRKWSVKGHLDNGDIAFNENKLTSRKSAFEWIDALLEKHNQEAQHSCVVFYGEEELED